MEKGKVVLGTLAGFAIGVGVGVLFAPAKGSETRKKIRDKSDMLIDNFKSALDSISDKIEQQVDQTKSNAENLVEKGKDKFDDIKKDVVHAATTIKKEVNTNTNHSSM